MTIRTKPFPESGTGNPGISGLRYGQPAKKSKIESVFHEADAVIANTCRCLLSVGQHGADHLQILSSSTTSALQTYPLKTRETVVARRPPVKLTPGCFPYVLGTALESGPFQKYHIDSSQWKYDGAGGSIKVVANYNSGLITHERIFPIPASGNANNAEDQGAGKAWFFEIFGGALTDQAIYQLCSDGATVELTVSYLGSPRVIDLGIFEVPLFYRRDTATDPDEWMVPLSQKGAQGDPKPVPIPFPSEYPIEELSTTDPWYGTRLLADVSIRQQTQLGPILCEWSAWGESTVSVTATEAAGLNATVTSFQDILYSDLIDWSSDNPGWSVSSGGSAQQFATSNHLVEFDGGKDAVVPVRCWIYGSRSVSGTSYVRFQTERYSICEVKITSSTPQWWSATGHIRCGVGAEDASVLELIAKASAGSTLNIKHMLVEYLNT